MIAPQPLRAPGVRALVLADMARRPRARLQPGLDIEALAAVPLTGGHIRNTIVRAAFLAAEDGTAVGMRHVRRALHSELTKLGRPAPKEWRR